MATVGPHCPWRVMVPPPQVECSEIMLKAINLSWSAITFTIGLSINSPDHDANITLVRNIHPPSIHPSQTQNALLTFFYKLSEIRYVQLL